MPSPLSTRLLNGVLVVSALVAILALGAPPAWMPAHYVAKPLATIAIIALAALTANPVSARYQRFMIGGLAFSLVGDVLLMLPTDLFAAGLGAFLLAHLCYIAAYLGESRFLARPPALAGYALVALTLLAALYTSLPAALRLPVIIYVVVITLMAAQSAVWMLESPSESSRRAAIGAAWFLVSDATLAISRFRTEVPYRDLIVLGTYYIAQWCLARSVARDTSRSRMSGTVARLALVLALFSAIAPAATLGAQSSASALMRAGDIDTLSLHRAFTRVAYGADSLQFGDLRLPEGRGPFPVAIVIHGGCWMSRYATLRNTAALSEALADAGIATWNLEYRRYDHPGGGWPGTFRDVADGADHVRILARRYPLDTTRVVVAGHSAGGQLALWLATRRTLEVASPLAGGTPLALAGIVSIGGVADLREFYARERATCGNPAVESLLGGVPDSVAARVREASPIERLPLGVPSVHLAGDRDRIAPVAVREAFVRAARQRGDSAWVVTIPGDGHFEAIAPSRAGGRAVIDAVQRLMQRTRP